MSKRILIVDDEPDILDLLSINLRTAGYTVLTAGTGSVALKKARSEKPDLILLDLTLPEVDGLEVCTTLKRDPLTCFIPIIIVTAKNEVVDRVVGLELGAEDYIAKPFNPREVILRIKSILRHGPEKPRSEDRLQLGILSIERSRHQVLVGKTAIDLTATEFKLLAVLMERRGRVQDRERLLNDVWGYESAIDTRTVDTHVRRLREKLGRAASYIETVRGVGYRMSEPNEGRPGQSPRFPPKS